jgi:glutamate-1-semialdehyde 2,1-aminomutase
MFSEPSRSSQWFTRALDVIPGGVNSPVRAFNAVGGEPFFVERAQGARILDVDGDEYLDYVLSWGPLILGHAHPAVMRAIAEALARGTSFGAPTPPEVELAELVRDFFPSMQLLRFVNSGTEATMSAVRVARGFTGRDLLVQFDGCYHGHGDSFLVRAGSGVATLGLPNSPGVPAELSHLTLSAPFNDLDAVAQIFHEFPDRVAAIIVEPVMGNAGFIPPVEGFLEGLRTLTREHGAILIFDEVMTGFRVALGGAQARYGVTPDLSTFGKIIGGGMPVGAYGGKRELMRQIAPSGPIYQAGTLSGNPVAMAAGLATLELIQAPGFHAELERRTHQLCDGLQAAADAAGVPFTTTRSCAMFGLYFREGPVRSYADAMASDAGAFRRFFHAMLRGGVYLAPSAFEAGFLSSAHGDAEIDATLAAARVAFEHVRA